MLMDEIIFLFYGIGLIGSTLQKPLMLNLNLTKIIKNCIIQI